MTMIRSLIAVVALGALLAGCATGGPAKGDPAKIVEQRALQRWSLLIDHKAEQAYDLLSPGYRTTKSRDDYAKEMNHRPVKWTKVSRYEEQPIDCSKPDVCKISLQVEVSVKVPGTSKIASTPTFLTETWIHDKGQWWYLPSGLGAGFRGKGK